MTHPFGEFKSYQQTEAGKAHPLGGGIVDEFILASEGCTPPIEAEAAGVIARAAFGADIEAWKHRAAEDAGRAE